MALPDEANELLPHNFHRNIRKLLADHGGISALAVDTGISFWTINDWLRKDTQPRLDSVLRVAKCYELDLNTLITGKI